MCLYYPGEVHIIVVLRRLRRCRGSMLALVCAMIMGVLMLILMFALIYTRLLGASHEQKTAIEAAALAAAKDLGRIVINTDQFGYVSLSDAAPVGVNLSTMAGDALYLPVHGINTLIGTARLDFIIADLLNDPIMAQLARRDASNAANVAAQQLAPVLNASIVPGGSSQARDVFNNVVMVYDDAEAAYKQNNVRMSGGSQYVQGSLRLSLGYTNTPSPTNIPVPDPTNTNMIPVPANQQISNFYLSSIDVPYPSINFGTQSFVFAAVGRNIKLSNISQWSASSNVSNLIPTIVKAEADHRIYDQAAPQGRVVHAVACAEPANNYDTKPAPGAMAVGFPDGAPSVLNSAPYNTPIGVAPMLLSSADLRSSQNGDFPVDAGAGLVGVMTTPWNNANPTMGEVWRAALYDWIRRGGVKANVADVLAKLNTPFGPPTQATVPWTLKQNGVNTLLANMPAGVQHVYTFNANGTVQYNRVFITPYPYAVVADRQWYAEGMPPPPQKADLFSADAMGQNTIQITQNIPVTPSQNNSFSQTMMVKPVPSNQWDVCIRDECRQPGINLGGKHGGEPLDQDNVARSRPASSDTRLIAGEGRKTIASSDASRIKWSREVNTFGRAAGPITANSLANTSLASALGSLAANVGVSGTFNIAGTQININNAAANAALAAAGSNAANVGSSAISVGALGAAATISNAANAASATSAANAASAANATSATSAASAANAANATNATNATNAAANAANAAASNAAASNAANAAAANSANAASSNTSNTSNNTSTNSSTNSTSSSVQTLGTTGNNNTNKPGLGAPPEISDQTDFAYTTSPRPPYYRFRAGGGGSSRPTYTTTGSCIEVRFRRQIELHDPNTNPTVKIDVGYVGVIHGVLPQYNGP